MAMSEQTFNSYLAKILSARYGEEVRGSIHDSLQGMYEIVKGNVLDVTTAKQTIDTAAAAANSAASKANTAATNADAATAKANASATKADTAAAGANTAKDAANTAASKATTEAGKATTAATQANAAASSANSAASAATEAASKVDTAIEKAETATSSANKAAESANTAKSEADKATTRANDAAAIIETLDLGDINTGEIATKDYVAERIVGRNYILNSGQTFSINAVTVGRLTENFGVCSSVELRNSMFGKTVTVSADYKCNIENDGTIVFNLYATWQSVKAFKKSDNGSGHIEKTINYGIPESPSVNNILLFMQQDYFNISGIGTVELSNVKFEIGDKATDWSPAPEDVYSAISRRSAVTYDYGGRNLKEVFSTPKALHDALAAEDYTNIAVGDYWPITLNGSFWDYGSYAVQSGKKYYSDNGLQTEAGTTEATYEGTYVSDNAVSFLLSGSTYYSAIGDCLPHFERTCNNVAFKLEVAGINSYWRYGDKGDLAGNKPHIVFISRNCFPFPMRMRKSRTQWESTSINNPWLGSALYKTLNDETHGVLPLVAATDVGAYIYTGPNNLGMRAMLETKAPDATNSSLYTWKDRGKLFLPTSSEVWGSPFWADKDMDGGLCNQFSIFRDSRRHISKGFGDLNNSCNWWTSSSRPGSAIIFGMNTSTGYAHHSDANNGQYVPICFVFA